MKALCFLLGIVVLTSIGCADRKNLSPYPTISDEAKADLKAPVDCSSAHNDIRILEEERASVAKQVLSGVRSIMPIAAAAGILMGDYRDRVKVATGVYNRDLDAKIVQIKSACGIR